MASNKQKEKKRHRKYRYRKLYLRVFYLLLIALAIILASPYYVGGGKVNTAKQTSTTVAGNADMSVLKSRYNPKNGLEVTEFFVGDKDQKDDMSSDKDLSNVKYQTRGVVQHGYANGGARVVKSKMIKVNDHFFILETKNLQPGYNVLRWDIVPQLIDKKIDTDNFTPNTWLKFYVRESNVKHDKKLRVKTKSEYQSDYLEMILNNYRHKIKKAKQKIQDGNATIAHDKALIEKMKRKKVIASNSQKDDIDDQISEYKDDITQQRYSIKAAKKTVKSNKANIKAAKRGSLNF